MFDHKEDFGRWLIQKGSVVVYFPEDCHRQVKKHVKKAFKKVGLLVHTTQDKPSADVIIAVEMHKRIKPDGWAIMSGTAPQTIKLILTKKGKKANRHIIWHEVGHIMGLGHKNYGGHSVMKPGATHIRKFTEHDLAEVERLTRKP